VSSYDSLTFSNLAGADPADVEVLFEKVQLLPQQLLVVPPRFHPLLPVVRMDHIKIQRECEFLQRVKIKAIAGRHGK
jgi:hypothetical protein